MARAKAKSEAVEELVRPAGKSQSSSGSAAAEEVAFIAAFAQQQAGASEHPHPGEEEAEPIMEDAQGEAEWIRYSEE
eukprot:1979489-Alexandrium_andersonii.AAC.1